MRKFLLGILSLLAASPAEAQDMTLNEAQKLYLDAKTTLDINEYFDPFYEPMQWLTDDEHGTNAPDRLPAFTTLVETVNGSGEAERAALVRWLIRYLWVARYPNYTQGAVRVLFRITDDEALREVVALDLLRSHPHGLARAAVIEPYEDYREWMEAPEMVALLHELALADPHPDVRRNALESLYASDLPQERMEAALKSDPAAEVRALWAARLWSQIQDPAKTEPALRAALFAPENAAVAPALMRAYLRSGPIRSDMQRLSQGLNYLKANPDHPLMSEIIGEFGWQADESALPTLLTGAPYADGAALRLRLQGLFADESAPLVARSRALQALSRITGQRIDPAAIADFMLDPAHVDETLSPMFDSTLGSAPMTRLFATWPASTAPQAKTQKEMIGRILDWYAAPRADGKLAGKDVQDGLLRELQRVSRIIPTEEDRAWLARAMLKHGADYPGDLTYGLSELLATRKLVDDEAFLAYFTAKGDSASIHVGASFVDRMRPVIYENPEPRPGDMTLAAKLVGMLENLHPGDPDGAYDEIRYFIYELPRRDELPADLPDLPLFEAKLRELLDRAPQGSDYSAISGWLEG